MIILIELLKHDFVLYLLAFALSNEVLKNCGCKKFVFLRAGTQVN